MKRTKWTVTRFKTNPGGRSYGPAGKYRFKTKFMALIVKKLFEIEAVLKLNGGYKPWLSYRPLYGIDTELGISYQDIGPWRSYHFNTSGDSLQELIDNAVVSEIDQDGGELDCYGIHDGTYELGSLCLELIHEEILRKS